jgi:hypothetical protein
MTADTADSATTANPRRQRGSRHAAADRAGASGPEPRGHGESRTGRPAALEPARPSPDALANPRRTRVR